MCLKLVEDRIVDSLREGADVVTSKAMPDVLCLGKEVEPRSPASPCRQPRPRARCVRRGGLCPPAVELLLGESHKRVAWTVILSTRGKVSVPYREAREGLGSADPEHAVHTAELRCGEDGGRDRCLRTRGGADGRARAHPPRARGWRTSRPRTEEARTCGRVDADAVEGFDAQADSETAVLQGPGGLGRRLSWNRLTLRIAALTALTNLGEAPARPPSSPGRHFESRTGKVRVVERE